MHINVQNERQFNKSEHCKSQVLTLAVYPFLKQHSKTFHPQPRKGTPFDLCRQYQNKLTRKTNSYKATSFVYLLSSEIDWSIWAKKRAAIKMGFEDNHGWSSESAPARVFLGQIGPCIFIVIRVQFS
jgi:hypothetical protein